MDTKTVFRAWEPLNKKMFFMRMALYESGDVMSDYALPPGEQHKLRHSHSVMNLDALKVMRPTELLDTTKNMIYESDYCTSLRFKSDVQGTVEYHSGIAMLVTKFGSYYLHECPGLLVIGNIYEGVKMELLTSEERHINIDESKKIEKLKKEMRRVLPILEKVFENPKLRDEMVDGLGIATLNGFKKQLES